jgi:hypothetical protein
MGTRFVVSALLHARLIGGSGLRNVPEVPFYTIEVGSRGDLSYSLEEMIATGWSIDLTLGS